MDNFMFNKKILVLYKTIFLTAFIFSIASCNFSPPNMTPNEKIENKEKFTAEQLMKMPNSEKYRLINAGFKIKGALRVEEDDEMFFYYSNNWTTVTDANASGGTFKRSIGTLLGRTEENGTNGVRVLEDGSSITEVTTYIDQDRWEVVTDGNASGGTYIKTNGMYETRIENNDPSLTYNGVWQQKHFALLGKQVPYSEGTLYNIEHNSGNTNLKYSETNSPWQTAHKRTFIYSSPVTIDDKSSPITYTGTWKKNSTLSYSNTVDNMIEMTFKGSNVHIYAPRTPYSGKIRVIVREKNTDALERTINEVDLYSSVAQTSVDVVQLQGLRDIEHTLKLQILEGKNASSTGTTFEFDKILVYPSIQYTFIGSSVNYSAFKDSKGGKVDIIMDAGTPERIDLYSPTSSFETIKEYTNLSPAVHKITIEGTNQTNPNSLSNIINAEKFSIYPNLGGSFVGRDIVVKVLKRPDFGIATFFVDAVKKLEVDLYSPTEKIDYIRVANITYGEHIFYLSMNGKKNESSTGYGVAIDSLGKDLPIFYRKFYGKDLIIYGNKGPNCGKIDLYASTEQNNNNGLDELKFSYFFTIDMYSPEVKYNQPLVAYGSIEGLQHIKLIPSLSKDDNSTGYETSIDYMGYGLPYLDMIFSGSEFTLYGNKGPDKGKATVIKDNNLYPPFDTIDLYSPTVEYNVPLITFSNLTSQLHTIQVKHILDRNVDSTGDTIEIDGYEYVNIYQPVITSITPSSGTIGEKIKIRGLKFPATATEEGFAVYFGNFNTSSIVQVKDLEATPADDPASPTAFSEEIEVLIPAGAETGKVMITTQKGGFVYSTDEFIINKPPYAEFSITPNIGTTATNFVVNATASSDAEDDPDPDKEIQLKINWGDGNETAYGTTKTFNHTYSTEGYKVVTLTVKDSANRETVATKTIYAGTAPPIPGWAIMAPVPNDGINHFGRTNAGAIEFGGKIFFIGGQDASGGYYYVDMYDPATNTWNKNNTVTLPVKPRPTIHTALGIYDGKILSYTTLSLGFTLNTGLDIYDPNLDPNLNSSVPAGTYPWDAHGLESTDPVSDRKDPLVVIDKGKVYLTGGLSGTAPYGLTFLTKLSVYDTISRTWDQSLPDMPTGAFYGRAEIINNKLYVMAGFKDYYDLWYSSCFNTINNKMRIFDFATKTWSESSSTIPTPRIEFTSTVINGKFYAIGGSNLVKTGNKVIKADVCGPDQVDELKYVLAKTVDVYDPATDSWSSFDIPVGQEVSRTTAVNLLNSFYTMGGVNKTLVNRYTLE